MKTYQRAGLAMILVVIAAIQIIRGESAQTLNWIQWFLLGAVALGAMLLVYEAG